MLEGGTEAWHAFGRPLVKDRTTPPDEACIDFYLRPYDRNSGVEEAMNAYLHVGDRPGERDPPRRHDRIRRVSTVAAGDRQPTRDWMKRRRTGQRLAGSPSP